MKGYLALQAPALLPAHLLAVRVVLLRVRLVPAQAVPHPALPARSLRLVLLPLPQALVPQVFQVVLALVHRRLAVHLFLRVHHAQALFQVRARAARRVHHRPFLRLAQVPVVRRAFLLLALVRRRAFQARRLVLQVFQAVAARPVRARPVRALRVRALRVAAAHFHRVHHAHRVHHLFHHLHLRRVHHPVPASPVLHPHLLILPLPLRFRAVHLPFHRVLQVPARRVFRALAALSRRAVVAHHLSLHPVLALLQVLILCHAPMRQIPNYCCRWMALTSTLTFKMCL